MTKIYSLQKGPNKKNITHDNIKTDETKMFS